jgi:hypothetical protein
MDTARLLSLFAVALMGSACKDPALEARVKDLETRLTAAEKKQAAGNEAKLLSALIDVHLRLAALEEADEARFSCEDKGYAFVSTQIGKFTVSCEDLRPFGDGYKAVLRIGNPHAVTLHGVKLNVRYGKRMPTGPESDLDEWRAGLREREVSVPDTLRPATWNRVEVVLAPAKAEDVGFLGVKMTVDRLSLH